MAYTLHEVIDRAAQSDIERDLEGQVVLYTGFYLWSDGYYRQEPEEKERDTLPQIPIAAPFAGWAKP